MYNDVDTLGAISLFINHLFFYNYLAQCQIFLKFYNIYMRSLVISVLVALALHWYLCRILLLLLTTVATILIFTLISRETLDNFGQLLSLLGHLLQSLILLLESILLLLN